MASSSAPEFEQLVSAAVADATNSREELGRTRAAEFRASPNDFDPGRLLMLGKPGLLSFVKSLDRNGDDFGLSTELSRAVVPTPDSTAGPGWSSQQNNGLRFETIGMSGGILAGIVAILTISFRVWLNG